MNINFNNPIHFKEYIAKLIANKTNGWNCEGKMFSKAMHAIYKNPIQMKAVYDYAINMSAEIPESKRRENMNKFLKKQCQQIENTRRMKRCQ